MFHGSLVPCAERRIIKMIEIDLNEQFIIYVVYKGCGKWYISDKEIWYLDYQKRIEAYRKRGYEIKEEYIDEERRDLLYVDEKNALLFLKRIEEDECSTGDLKELFLQNQEEDDYMPSLYVNFDKKLLYSVYMEPASYEHYVPVGWIGKFKKFFDIIPEEKCYWGK